MSAEPEHKVIWTFTMGAACEESCAVCGGKDCEHLKPIHNRNGDSFAPGALSYALSDFVGRNVTAQLRHEVSNRIGKIIEVLPGNNLKFSDVVLNRENNSIEFTVTEEGGEQ